MKKEKKLKNDYLSKSKSLKPNPDPEFFRPLLELVEQSHSEDISRIKNGISHRDSKTFFLLKKMRQYSLEISADDKTSTVENFIKATEDSLMAVMQSPDCYQILSEIKQFKYKEASKTGVYIRNFLEELNISDLSVLSDCSDYLDKIYKKEELFQKDLFEKVLALTRLFYAYLILDRLLKLREKIKEDSNNSSIWIDAYKIGVLEGNLGLIESFLDPDIEDIHYRAKSKEEVSKRWFDLNMLKETAVKMAAKKWMRGAQVTHVKMAVLVLEKLKTHYSRLTAKYSDAFMLKTIRKAVKPEARKYGWVQGEKGVKFTKRNT